MNNAQNEAWTGMTPSVNNFTIFFSFYFKHVLEQLRNKLDD